MVDKVTIGISQKEMAKTNVDETKLIIIMNYYYLFFHASNYLSYKINNLIYFVYCLAGSITAYPNNIKLYILSLLILVKLKWKTMENKSSFNIIKQHSRIDFHPK